MGDSLGDRMKRYERATRYLLPPRQFTVIRIDGKNFHGFTRHCTRPFDFRLMDAFEATARALVGQVHGALLAYHQSDEISVVMQDFASHGTEPWLGGVVQKQASVAASIATAVFNREWVLEHSYDDGRYAIFDGRTYAVPTRSEVANYLIWRQQDATRNSVNMAASAHFSHKSLHGTTSDQRQERLWSEAGVNWDDYPARAKRGTVTSRRAYVEDVTYVRSDTGETVTQRDVERSRTVTDEETPVFTQDRDYLSRLLVVPGEC